MRDNLEIPTPEEQVVIDAWIEENRDELHLFVGSDICTECNEPAFLTDTEVAHHGTPNAIDHDADAQHVALVGKGMSFDCSECGDSAGGLNHALDPETVTCWEPIFEPDLDIPVPSPLQPA